MSASEPLKLGEMTKAYDASVYEKPIYAWWESQGFFKPERAAQGADPFVISIPPPNVTGELHLGHAIFVSIEDVMIRYARMRGKAALWVPGMDHAGIATQLQVEKMLRAQGTSREAVGRQEFLRRTWEWKEKYGGHITRQLRRLGASCDWDRERFTLDDGLSKAVREAFVRLYEKGLIYRGEYLINWSPGLQTAVSDLEVDYVEEEGKLYYFKYPLAGDQGYIPVATTRPETILGDTAVCVHPDDERYRHLIGKTCLVPMLNRTIPVIHDTYVTMEFGTGALKVTPAHDINDFELAKRHGLQIINVLNTDATMNAAAGPYAGLDRFECRRRLWADMEKAGLTIKVEKYNMQVPRSQRGGEIVEPMISKQWFVRMKPLADVGLKAVHEGQITIIPERFERVYANWLENIRDWCISRQLWWGHRIPVWYCDDCGELNVARQDPTRCAKCGGSRLTQDPDVLDTWFSSGLWPFSTLGWPADTADLQRYYPTTVMETGYDILFFWVARMIMMGLEMTDKPPFSLVYLHGLVRDDQGRKMSKTIGNVVDPLWILEGAKPQDLPPYVRAQYPEGIIPMGADSLRFTLLTGSTPGNDMNLSLQRVEANRNFNNKIWNAARFVLSNLDEEFSPHQGDWDFDELNLPERWIISRAHEVTAEVTRLFDNYNYGEAGRQLYEFFWGELADWYIEISKISLNSSDVKAQSTTRQVLVYVLERTLRLLHPFIPFVTEAAWQYLPHQGESIMLAPWPLPGPVDANAEVEMALIIDVVRAIRNMRSEYDVDPKRRINAIIAAGEKLPLLSAQKDILITLARLEASELELSSSASRKPVQALTAVISGGVEIYLPLAGLVDLQAEKTRLEKELETVEAGLRHTRQMLGNERFVSKAPADVVEKEREKLARQEAQAQKLHERLASLD